MFSFLCRWMSLILVAILPFILTIKSCTLLDTVLDCSNQDLTDLNNDIIGNAISYCATHNFTVQTLNFSNNKLKHADLSKLVVDSKLKKILDTILTIDLRYNKLKSIDENLLSHLPSLFYMYLGYNPIKCSAIESSFRIYDNSHHLKTVGECFHKESNKNCSVFESCDCVSHLKHTNYACELLNLDFESASSIQAKSQQSTEQTSDGNNNKLGIIIGVLFGCMAVCSIVFMGIFKFTKRKLSLSSNSKVFAADQANAEAGVSGDIHKKKLQEEPSLPKSPLCDMIEADVPKDLFEKNDSQESKDVREAVRKESGILSKGSFVKLEELGSGAFGTVYKGALCHHKKYSAVAIKELETQDDLEIYQILNEAATMKTLCHNNVVSCIGVSVDESFCIILELLPLGDLTHYLQKSEEGDVSLTEKLCFAFQISLGMEYLQSQGVLHRDLATRNCMLGTASQETWGYPVLKVSDFGMSTSTSSGRDHYKIRESDRLPIYWMAPEVFKEKKYTHKCDVWAFGVTLWEIMTNAKKPYRYDDVNTLISRIDYGYRLERPEECPQVLFDIMTICWSANPEDRPDFKVTSQKLRSIFHTSFSMASAGQRYVHRQNSYSNRPQDGGSYVQVFSVEEMDKFKDG